MINGVLHIVAAVLFAVIAINDGVNYIWLGIAGVYLVTGAVNLAIYGLKMHKMEKAAKKAEKNNQKPETKSQEAEKTTGG